MHQPDLLLGIPKEIMAIIFCLTIIAVYLLGIWFIAVGVILYIPCCIISKNDPLLLSMAVNNLFQIDHLEG
jgi:type IV secretory pathway VirB3-like protein